MADWFQLRSTPITPVVTSGSITNGSTNAANGTNNVTNDKLDMIISELNRLNQLVTNQNTHITKLEENISMLCFNTIQTQQSISDIINTLEHSSTTTQSEINTLKDILMENRKLYTTQMKEIQQLEMKNVSEIKPLLENIEHSKIIDPRLHNLYWRWSATGSFLHPFSILQMNHLATKKKTNEDDQKKTDEDAKKDTTDVVNNTTD